MLSVRSPDHNSQPAAELPEHDGCAAAPKPWFAQFAEGRHGRTNAKHNGSVPTDAIISGEDSFKSAVQDIINEDAKITVLLLLLSKPVLPGKLNILATRVSIYMWIIVPG